MRPPNPEKFVTHRNITMRLSKEEVLFLLAMAAEESERTGYEVTPNHVVRRLIRKAKEEWECTKAKAPAARATALRNGS